MTDEPKPTNDAQPKEWPAGKAWTTADSYVNFEARVGYGTDNQSSKAGYMFTFTTRQRMLLEAMYRSSWIVGQVVDTVAEDMTKAGVKLTGGIDPGDMQKLGAAQRRLCLWDELRKVAKWGRLYGGAVGVHMVDGQDLKTPLDPKTIGKGQYRGIMPLDRWLVQPSITDLVDELGPDYGNPRFYDLVADGLALKRQTIHYSRVMRFEGVELPYWQKITEQGWGMSVIERLFDRLIAFDSTTAGTAQLVFKAHLRTYKVKGLREIISGGGAALSGLVKQMEFVRRYQSNEGITLMDAEDEFDTHQFTFAGLDDVLLQFAQQLSGAAQIPLQRLFGQSPKGMNATGEADMQTYYEHIQQEQESRFATPVNTMMQLLARSELGGYPEDFGQSFNPLAKLSALEKADVATKITASVLDALEACLISPRVALLELRQSSEETGVWSNITDKDIAAADDKPPEPPPLPDPNAPPGDPNAPPTDEPPQAKP